MEKSKITYFESILALFFMFFFVFVGYLLFDLRVELMMIAAAASAGLLALRSGLSWKEMESAISTRIVSATPAILIIWVIGIVIATFIYSGSIPMLIYYGIQIVSPEHLLISAFGISAIFSLVTGTSWGSVGTIGVAMMSISVGVDVPLHITAAAVISGAILGDKMSPLSETTNLASATAGVDLYDHIKSMTWTTFPAAIITFIVLFFTGKTLNVSGQAESSTATTMLSELEMIFDWNLLLIAPFIIILIGAMLKKPPVPVMLLGSLTALLIGVFYQGFTMENGVEATYGGFDISMIPNAGSTEWSESILTLLNRGGMLSMVSVVIIIYCGYAYTAIISKAGFLETALNPLTSRVKKRGPLMVTTLFTELLILVFSGTSYTVAIMIPEMFKRPFIKAGMSAKALSRTIEDVGTMVAAFVPWGTSGAFYIATLGVPIFGEDGYAKWTVLSYTTPIIAIILAFAGVGVYKMSKDEIKDELAKFDKQHNLAKIEK